MVPDGQVGRAEVVGGEVRALGQERVDDAARSPPARSCTSSRRACRPGAGRAAPGAQDLALQARRAPRARPPPCASARRAARRACRGPSTAGRPARGRRPRAPAAARRRPRAPRRSSAPMRAGRARERLRRGRRGARPPPRRPGPPSARPGAWSCRPGRRTGRARARPAAGARIRATAIAARDCGMNAPCSHSGEPSASKAPSSTSPSGSSPARVRGHRQLGGERRGGRAQRVRAQRRLRRAVAGRHQRAGVLGPERLEPRSAIQCGWECRSAASAAVRSGSAADERAALARGRGAAPR